jgi:two-component system, cell cycle sensor histidine kinase and response regulator CckA
MPDKAHPAVERSAASPLPARPADLLDLVPCAVIEVAVDDAGAREITYFSRAATEIYGYEGRDAVGRDPLFLSARPGEGDAGARTELERTGRWRGRTRHRTRDGREIDVELQCRAWRDQLGRVKGYLLAAQDVTAEMERTRLLAERSALLELAPDAIFARDVARRITFWNGTAEATYGYSREEVLGHDPAEVLRTEYPIPLEEIERIVERSGSWEGDLVQTARDGRRFTVASNWGALYDEHGSMVGLLEINRDATERLAVQTARERALADAERTRLSQRLVRAQRLESLGQLAGGIAHDFNNLLAVIAGYATALTDGVQDLGGALPKSARDGLLADVEEVARATQRAAALTHQLLAFARQESVRLAPVMLNDVISDLRELIGRSIGEHVRLETDLAPDLLHVKADAGQLGQVLVNLAVNARDAMPDGGALTLETGNVHLDELDAAERQGLTPGWHVQLVVRDDGVGMPPEVMEHAFDPFFTTKTPGEGTGLGLATVYGIITGAGGLVSLYSEPGRGTALRILLPALEAAPVAPGPAASEEPPRAEGDRTVLVVEDQAPLRAITVRILERAGYHVLSATSGPEALAIAAAAPREIDLLLTDVVMPEMLGQVLAQELRRARPDLRVIFTSGFARPALEHGGRPLEDPLLQKPVPARELLAQVAAVLSRRG